MKPVIIIGAGPAGLTAAIELQRAGWPQVTVLEASTEIGGLSRTVEHRGHRIDIGGHRFFSKSDWVMDWWREQLPVAWPAAPRTDGLTDPGAAGAEAGAALHRLLGRQAPAVDASARDVMLLRRRLSRIHFGGRFFDYPLTPNLATARALGWARCARFGASYAAAALRPIRPERSLEDFFINRFGRALYRQFFQSYTEKVWGVPCDRISAAWGAQRVKSLSVTQMLLHGARRAFGGPAPAARQTSLIEHFLYPRLGPGQMWTTVAERFQRAGGQLRLQSPVVALHREDTTLQAVSVRRPDGGTERLDAAHVISTMPLQQLSAALRPALPQPVAQIAAGLQYRDFITVGVLLRRLRPTAAAIDARTHIVPDNWIYIQDAGVQVGRLQIFNNWSPDLVADPRGTVWLGLEFFAQEGDALWSRSDASLTELALRELDRLGLADPADLLDTTVIRAPKAYPAYFGEAWPRFEALREALDGLHNLWLVGRNGMHRYNNQDHSMLSARHAVQAIVAGRRDKQAVWSVNIDDSYHEETDAAG